MIDYFNDCVCAYNFGIAVQIKIIGVPLLVLQVSGLILFDCLLKNRRLGMQEESVRKPQRFSHLDFIL
jgi:hypothetical protein